MKKKKVKKLILVFALTLMIITSNFYIYANDTKGANEILIQILNNADLSKINYLQGINIKENEYQEIQKFTLELVNNCKNDEEKMNTIFKWVHENVKYGNANNDPYEVFINRVAVCQGYANLYTVMMDILNIPTILIQGNTYFGAHAWCLTNIKDNWILIDPTNYIIRYDVKDYDAVYTNSYFTPTYIHSILLEDDNYGYTYYDGVAIIENKTNNKIVTMPDEIYGLQITTFCTSTLNTNTEELNLNRNIKNIINNAQNDNVLKKITIDDNNENYSDYNNILYSKDYSYIVFIPNYIEKVELKPIEILQKGTLSNLEYIDKIVISEGTKQIQDYCFEKLENLKEVYIPDSVISIGKDAFYNIGSDFTIYTNTDSIAHKYALENNIKFILLDNKFEKGDVNKDGAINSIDASMVIDMYKKNNAITQDELNIADMNNDNSINSVDASMIIDMYKNNEI